MGVVSPAENGTRMNRGDRAIPAQADSCVGVCDESGFLQNWTTAFDHELNAKSHDIAACSICDLIPEIDENRWRAIWKNIEGDAVEHIYFDRQADDAEAVELFEIEVCRLAGAGKVLAKVELRRAVTETAMLRMLQQEILEGMASGAPLPAIMDVMCRRAESLAPSVVCSLLRIDAQGRMQHLASPSLPDEYCDAVNGVSIGPQAGSCGTAAYRGKPVETPDIETDPLWADYKQLVLPLGLRACWSYPIKSSQGAVLGVIGFYFRTARRPSSMERQIVATCANICAIALEHEETRRSVYELAFKDPITGLDNRIRFQQRVDETLGVFADTEQQLVVHYIGLDQFHAINDALGHATGDEMLRVMAERLKRVMGEGDIIARIGSDEFAVVQIGDIRAEDAAALARRLIDVLEEPYGHGSQHLIVHASVGIAFARKDGMNAGELIKNAALAMLRVKDVERGSYFFYEKALNDRMQIRQGLESGLIAALGAGEFEVHYQPILSLDSMQIVGAEALIRWRHPERGLTLPSEFVPIAEETGLIVPLGAWALEQACMAAASWPEHIEVAVNLSPVQFARLGLVSSVESALERSGLRPSRLRLEITESVLLHDSAVNVAILDQLSDLGVSIVLDDFGTGYSSLSYLQRFAFDHIKIDQAFVKNISDKPDSLKIVRSIVMLAHSLGLSVTAEGVETDAQFASVRGEGCDEIQGHYVGAAAPEATFVRLLASEKDQRAQFRTANN